MKYLEWSEFNGSRHHAILKTAISAGDFGEFEDNPTELPNDQSILCQSYELPVKNKNYFTSCDPHHDIYTFSYWQIFWHSI